MRAPFFLLLLPLTLLAAPREARIDPGFEGPVETFAARNELKQLAREFTLPGPDGAAHLETLLREHADDLSTNEMGLVSVRAYVQSILPSATPQFIEEYRKQWDTKARDALSAVRADPAAKPESYYHVGQRYPLSTLAAEAFVEAADRAVTLGDASSAEAFYELAERRGWKPDESHQYTVAQCRALSGHDVKGVSPEVARALAGANSTPKVYQGMVPFPAPWYGQRDDISLAKYIPFISNDVAYFIGARDTIAINKTGHIAWRWSAATARSEADRQPNRGRGTLYVPAILESPLGAQIIVARQQRGVRQDFCLRAWRAGDGKLLWTTEGSGDSLSYASNPAVAGRFVYAVAVDFAEDVAALVLVAHDVLDGKLLFKTTLGQMTQMRRRRQDPRGWDSFWEQTEPAVAGEQVIVSPNVGVAFAMDRFDGKIRWVHSYDDDEIGARPVGKRPENWDIDPKRPVPKDPLELLRYRNTPAVCGDRVVIAPQDTSSAFGLVALTGREMWKNDTPPGHTLIGGTDSAALFAGVSVGALNAATGKLAWLYDPKPAIDLAGLPVTNNDVVYLPERAGKVTTISASDGKPLTSALKAPSLSNYLGGGAARKALEEGQILKTIVSTPVDPNAPIGKQ